MSVPLNFVRRGGQSIFSAYYPSNILSKLSLFHQNNVRKFMYNNSLLLKEQNPFLVIANNKEITQRLQHLIFLRSWSDSLSYLSTWFIKRTFQPSIIRKRRKTGFLSRQKTVGGRRILKRRMKKGRMRLGGC